MPDVGFLEALFLKMVRLAEAEQRMPDRAGELRVHRRRLEERFRAEAQRIQEEVDG